MGEVEAQPVGGDERACLPHMWAKHLAQGGVKHVRGGMVTCSVLAAHRVDIGFNGVAQTHRAFADLAEVHDDIGHDCLCVVYFDDAIGTRKRAGIADLPTALGVEGCLHKHDFYALTCGCLAGYLVVGYESYCGG